jgi:hypothetical protein
MMQGQIDVKQLDAQIVEAPAEPAEKLNALGR